MKTTTVQDVTTVITSKLFSLKARDFLRGLFMAVGGTALAAIYAVTMNKGATLASVDWGAIGMIGLNTGINYLILNFFTKGGVKVVDAPKEFIEAVKVAKEESKDTDTSMKVTIGTVPAENPLDH